MLDVSLALSFSAVPKKQKIGDSRYRSVGRLTLGVIVPRTYAGRMRVVCITYPEIEVGTQRRESDFS